MGLSRYLARALTRKRYLAKDGSRYVRGRNRSGKFWTQTLKGPIRSTPTTNAVVPRETLSSRRLLGPKPVQEDTRYAPPTDFSVWKKNMCACPQCARERNLNCANQDPVWLVNHDPAWPHEGLLVANGGFLHRHPRIPKVKSEPPDRPWVAFTPPVLQGLIALVILTLSMLLGYGHC